MLVWLFFSLALADSNNTNDFCDTCIKVDYYCYNVSYLFDIDAPYRNRIVIPKLGILRSSNTLFYSFEPAIDDDEYYKVGVVSMDDPTQNFIISGGKLIMNFGTFDFDQDNNLVYLGGSNGIYVLDTNTRRVSPYSSRGDIVLSIFYKGHVYFVRDGEFKIVKKKGDNFDILLEHMAIKNFVINKYNVIVYLSTYGLFVHRNGQSYQLSKNPFFRGLTIDLQDVVYAWWVDSIYRIDIATKLIDTTLTKIADVPGIGALTFDNDNNFIFTADKSLYRLIETNITSC